MIISTSTIFFVLERYKYLIIFPIAVIEGPIITIIAGFLASKDVLNFYLIYFLIVIADICGDLLFYSLGRFGRISLFEKLMKKLRAKQSLDKIEKHFESHSGKTILFSKFAHGIGSLFFVAAGMARMPLANLIFFDLMGTLPKSFILMLIGYFFGQALSRIRNYLDYISIGFIVLFFILLMIYLVIVLYSRKKEKNIGR